MLNGLLIIWSSGIGQLSNRRITLRGTGVDTTCNSLAEPVAVNSPGSVKTEFPVSSIHDRMTTALHGNNVPLAPVRPGFGCPFLLDLDCDSVLGIQVCSQLSGQ